MYQTTKQDVSVCNFIVNNKIFLQDLEERLRKKKNSDWWKGNIQNVKSPPESFSRSKKKGENSKTLSRH